MATYVLVHGGAHGGWCYGPVARRLRAAGHEVHAPTLTGLGERSHLLRPGIDLDTHIEDVVRVLHYEDVRDAILVGHSYGGMVITGVADRRSTGWATSSTSTPPCRAAASRWRSWPRR
jgi:pimeloyl-ACP methyl ester carboxylesterase